MTGSREFWDRTLPVESRQIAHVCHSLRMLGSLPSERELATSEALSHAALESWLVHVRLLAEFFLVKPARTRKDFSARDFGWEGTSGIDTHELVRFCELASRHLVHFSRERAPDDIFELDAEDVGYAALVVVSEKLLQLARAFVAELETRESPMAPQMRDCLEIASTALTNQPQVQ